MAVAMAGTGYAVGQAREGLVFGVRGDVGMRGLARRGGAGVGYVDRSHERFYAVRVRCGKKERSLAVKVAKVQELVKVQRDLVLLSQQSARVAPESPILMGVSEPVLDRLMQNLQDLQVEVESINLKTKKKKGSSSSSSSSSSSASESSDSDTGKALLKSVVVKKKQNCSSSSSSSASSSSSSESDVGKVKDMRALRKKNVAKLVRNTVAQSVSADKAISSIPKTLAEPSFNAEASGVVMHSSPERIAAQVSVRTSSDEEEPAIVAQIRALCSTATVSSSSNTREIYSRGPIELKDTPIGRVIVTPPSVSVSVSKDASHASTSGKIEVCTVGKCRRGGAQQILSSLQASIPESSNISVTSCKCMGKCKSAPNLRVKSSDGQAHPLGHVSVDDVDTLLQFHFGLQSLSSPTPPLFARIDSDFTATA